MVRQMSRIASLAESDLDAIPARQGFFHRLADLRQNLGRLLWLRSLALFVLALQLLWLIGSLLAWLELGPLTLGYGLLTGLGLGLLGILWQHLRHPARSQDPQALARWLDQNLAANPEMARKRQSQHAAESAVCLALGQIGDGESFRLANEAVLEATRELRQLIPTELISQGHRQRIWGFFIAAFALALALAGLASFKPDALKNSLFAIQQVFSREAPAMLDRREPQLGAFQIHYRYPAYAERSERSLISADGRVFALAGTEVELRTQTPLAVEKASLLIEYGQSGRVDTELEVRVSHQQLSTRFVLSRAGRFRLRLTTLSGEVYEQREGQAMELEPDKAPELQLIVPSQSPMEVNLKDRLRLVYQAQDDFRLGPISVAWRVLGSPREGRELIDRDAIGERSYQGEAELVLSKLPLKPGDRVAYTVEVTDNDTVSGPKIGASTTMELRIYSERAHHRSVMEIQDKALGELIELLGDQLERPELSLRDTKAYTKAMEDEEAILRRADTAEAFMARAYEAILKDPLGQVQIATAFDKARNQLIRDRLSQSQAVFRTLRFTQRRRRVSAKHHQALEEARKDWIAHLETSLVYLSDLMSEQRMLDAESLSRELRKQQEALRQALLAYQAAPTEAQRALLSETIQKIRDQIREISQELSQLRASIPPDFVNAEALSPADPTNLNAMEQLIEDGDLEGAMQALDQMLSDTERMIQELQGGRSELGSREYSEVQAKAQKIQEDLGQLQTEQRALARRTEGISKKQIERMQSQMTHLESFVKSQVERVKKAKDALDAADNRERVVQPSELERSKRRLDDALRALEAEDFGASQDVLSEAAEIMAALEAEANWKREQAENYGDAHGLKADSEKLQTALRTAKEAVSEAQAKIQEKTPRPGKMLSPGEQNELKAMQKEQMKLKSRAEALGKALLELNDMLPVVGPKASSAIQEAQKAMQGARDRLKEGNAPGGLKFQRGALDELQRLQTALGERSGQPQQGKGGKSGIMMPFGQNEGSGQRGGGRASRSSYQRVEIPKPEGFQTPDAFRKDILEAARQGTVKSYEEAVRRYYEELVR